MQARGQAYPRIKKNGAGTEDIYTAKLWCFNRIDCHPLPSVSLWFCTHDSNTYALSNVILYTELYMLQQPPARSCICSEGSWCRVSVQGRSKSAWAWVPRHRLWTPLPVSPVLAIGVTAYRGQGMSWCHSGSSVWFWLPRQEVSVRIAPRCQCQSSSSGPE